MALEVTEEVPLSALSDPVLMLSIYNEPIREGLMTLYPWQVKSLIQFSADPLPGRVRRLAIVANNGSGKSQYLIAPSAAWLGMKFKRARAVITSASGMQLDRQVGQSLDHICGQVNKLHQRPLWKINYRFYTYLPTNSTIELYATDDPGLAEGYHPHLGGTEFAMFCDEGKSIPEEIYGAIERCNGMTRRMDVSSPGKPSGHFYDVFIDSSGRWWQLKVTYKDCPHIKEDEVEEFAARFGRNSPLFRSSYLAEFSSVDEDVIMTWNEINNHFRSLPDEHLFGERFAGGDLAAGGDENTFAVFEGNKHLGMECWREEDTTKAAEFIEFLMRDKYKIKPENCNFDDGGVGKAIIDMLWKKGLQVNRVLNQSPAIRKDIYANRGAELWFHFKSILPDIRLLSDTLLKNQLANRYYYQQKLTNKIVLEPKREARAKGHGSPDRADAVILAFANKPSPYIGTLLNDKSAEVKKPKGLIPTQEELIKMMDKIKFGDIVLPSGRGNRIFSSLDATLEEEANRKYYDSRINS